MRQLFLERSALAIKEVCEPVLDDHSVLISVSYSFMSSGSGVAKIISSRQHSILNKIPNKVKKIAELIAGKGLNYSSLIIKDRLEGRSFDLGHSCSGVVIAVGSKVQAFRAGDLVACAGTDFANHADVVCVPQHLVVKVGQESQLKAASLTGIGAIALHGVERASLQLGQTVAVFGLELAGQLTMQLCQILGCNVIGIDSDASLLQKAQDIGIKKVYDINQDNVVQIIDMLTDYTGIDCVIVTPDFVLDNRLDEIVSIVKKGGKIVLTSHSNVPLPVELACSKEINLAFAAAYKTNVYEQRSMHVFIDLISSGRLDLTTLMQNEYLLNDLSLALDQVQQKQTLGVVINYQNYDKLKNNLKLIDSQATEPLFTPARREQNLLKIAVIGAAKHIKSNILPIFAQQENLIVNTILNTPNSLINLQTDDSNIIFISKDVDIDLDVLISLLQQNKAIFVERPFIDTVEKLEKLENFLLANPRSQLCIGYHYRYANFIQKIKLQLKKRSSPFMLQYRLNLGEIPKEQRFIGAWRFGGVMAQAAYILDLFYFLADAKPLSVSVEALRTPGESVFSTDNFSATINFADGSICALLFTTIGNPDAGKESLELFFDAKTIILNDYQDLTGYGVAPYFDEKDREPDTGLSNMVLDFLHNVQNNTSILKINDLVTSAKLALTVDKMVY